MAGSCISLASVWDRRIRKSFVSAGLVQNYLKIDNETTIHCWAPKQSVGGKKNLVLIHGFGTNSMWQWYQQVRCFSQTFNLFIPDLVFFGESTTTSSERSEIFQAHCVFKAMKKLEVDSFSVVGTSYGGFVAYHLGLLYPQNIDKVVIASSGVCRNPQHNVDLLSRANLPKISDLLLPQCPANLRTLMKLSISKYPIYLVPNFVLSDVLQIHYVENREEKVELLTGVVTGTNSTQTVPVIDKDVLIVWGQSDQIFPIEMAYEFKKYLGSRAELVVIKDASHIPQIEKPEEFNKSVMNFLSHD